MLTAKSVFEQLEGKELTYEDFRQKLKQVWSENIDKLPPEFGTRELFTVGFHKGWIEQHPNGMIKVTVARRSTRRAKTAKR